MRKMVNKNAENKTSFFLRSSGKWAKINIKKRRIPWIKKRMGWILFFRTKIKTGNPAIKTNREIVKFGEFMDAYRSSPMLENMKMRKNRKDLRLIWQKQTSYI